MKVAVLDYSSGSVDIFEVPEGGVQAGHGYEHIKWYLTEVKEYRLEFIHWMEVNCINIHI